jgi:hypothetical protein
MKPRLRLFAMVRDLLGLNVLVVRGSWFGPWWSTPFHPLPGATHFLCLAKEK